MKSAAIYFLSVTLLVTSTYAEDPWTPSPLCPYPSEEQTRYPYEGDCSKYWECFEGARYPMDCPSGLEFNANVSQCDDPTIAKCDPDATIIYPTFSHSTVSTQSTLSTKDPGPLPDCPFPSDELTFFPVATNCSQYWECFQGNRYLMTCPSGLYWNTLYNYCDYLENVDCSRNNTISTTSTTTDITTPWTPDPECPYPSEELTFFPHPTNCSEYYECYEGNKFLMSCREGLYWNDIAKTCDYAENVDCSQNSTTSSTPTTSTGSTDSTISTGSTDPTATTNTTEPSTVTTSTTVTTGSPTSSTTLNPICTNEPDGTYLPHPTDCSKFYECVGGQASEEQCPGALLWNVEAHTCDYAWNVNCTTTEIY